MSNRLAPTLTLALALLLPGAALAQDDDRADRKGIQAEIEAEREARAEALQDRLAIDDPAIAPIAEAIHDGAPESRIESDWTELLEEHAEGMEESDADVLTLRVLASTWERMKGDFSRGVREVESSGACGRQTATIARERTNLERALASRNPTDADLRAATSALDGISESLAACEEALASAGDPPTGEARPDRRIANPAAKRPGEIEKPTREAELAEPRIDVAAAADPDPEAADADAAAPAGGDGDPMANVDLQNWLQKNQQSFQALSNVSKTLHDSAMAVIRKIGG